MPRSDDPTLPPLPNVTRAFRNTTPEAYLRAQGDPDTLRRLGAVETRTEAIKQRFFAHFEKHEVAWTAAEALKLANKRDYPTLQHAAPRGFDPPGNSRVSDFAELMSTKARQNVHARAITRLSAINAIEANLQNALVRNRPVQVRQRERELPANDQSRPAMFNKQ